jgi:hypothetical protein
MMSAPAIQFKGTGWYVTDYARSSSRVDSESRDATAGSAKSETKPEQKTPTKETKKPAAKQK